jgi:Predicted phosphatases
VDGAGGARDRALLVGDSVTDRKTAAAAGAPCVLVSFAPGDPDVQRLAPEAVIDRFADLPAAVARLIG